MSFYDKHLYVKKSTLPGAGKGLFTKVLIPKGNKIAEYRGEVHTWKEILKMTDERNGYVFYFNRNYVIDAWQTRKGMAHYANDAKGLVRMPGLKNNAEYDTEGKRCFLVASRDISPRSEILVGYGPEYWQAIRYNIREEQKKNGRTGTNGHKVELPHHLSAKRRGRPVKSVAK